MADGPNIQGQIVINTKSVNEAVRSVQRLGATVKEMAQKAGVSATKVANDIEKQKSSYNSLIGLTRNVLNADRAKIEASEQYRTSITRAANSIANFESTVRASNLTAKQQAQLIASANAQLKGYDIALKTGLKAGASLSAINTQLSASVSQLNREMRSQIEQVNSVNRAHTEAINIDRQRESTLARTERAVSQANSQLERTRGLIRASAQEDTNKTRSVRELETAHSRYIAVLRNTQSSTVAIAKAQAEYRTTLDRVAIAARNAGTALRSKQTKALADEFRNLTSSVVVALGPLSGVASRLIALQGLFNRNAASLAALLGGITAFAVGLQRSSVVSMEAEKIMLRIESQLEAMGSAAKFTGDEISNMAHRIAGATLLSANEVRQAAGALIEFGGIGRSQFEEVILSAQGMATVFRGTLQQNIRLIGRAIEDPIRGFARLQQIVPGLTNELRDQMLVLQQQGRRMDATALLLRELESLQSAAKNEASGLAGAYDAVSDSMNLLFERLFIGSGAIDVATKNISEMAEMIKDFAESENAIVIGVAFKTASNIIGSSVKFIVNNINILIGAFSILLAVQIPRLVLWLKAKLLVELKNTYDRFMTAAISAIVFSDSLIKARASAASLFAVLKPAIPMIIGIGVAVYGLISAYRSYNKTLDDVKRKQEDMSLSFMNQVELIINARQDLSQAQKDTLMADAAALENALAREERLRENAVKNVEQTQDRIRSQQERTRDFEARLFAERKKLSGFMARFRSEEANAETRVEIERLNKLRKDSIDREIILQRQLKVSQDRLRELGHQVRDVSIAQSELMAASADVTKEQMEFRAKVESSQASLASLTNEYLNQETAIQKIQRQLEQAKTAQATFIEAMNRGGRNAANFRGEVDDLNKIIKILQERLEELQVPDEITKTAEKFIDDLIKLGQEADIMAESIATGATPEVLRLSRALNELDGDVIAKIGEMLNVEGGRSDVVDTLISATALQQARISAMREEETIQQRLNQLLSNQQPEVDKLFNRYLELAPAMVHATEEQRAAIDAMFARESALLDQRAKDITEQPFVDVNRMTQDMMMREQMLADIFGRESDEYELHMQNLKNIHDRTKPFLAFAQGAEIAADVVGQSMEVMQNLARQNSKKFQALAIGQAVIQQALAVANIWGGMGGIESFPLKLAMSALAGAQVGAQIAAIRKQSFAAGGFVRGPGTGTSDSIPAMLSNGEYVINAAAVKRLGLSTLNSMNSGNMPRMATGGLIGSSSASGGGYGDVNITIVDQTSGGSHEFSTEQSLDPNGARQLRILIRDTVKGIVAGGELDREMTSRYDGIRTRGIRR